MDRASRINQTIAAEIGAGAAQVSAAVKLLDDGATVPFVARYRKEATGGLDVWVTSPDAVRAAVMSAETVTVPECDSWRLPYLGRLLEDRQRLHYSGRDTGEVQQLRGALQKKKLAKIHTLAESA